jgi:hypothetical protein
LLLLGAVSADRCTGSAGNNIGRVTVPGYIRVKIIALVVRAAGSNTSGKDMLESIGLTATMRLPLYLFVFCFACVRGPDCVTAQRRLKLFFLKKISKLKPLNTTAHSTNDTCALRRELNNALFDAGEIR